MVGGEQEYPQIDFIFLGKFIFIKMDNYENAIAYIEEQEATEISYVKVGDNSKNLIVSFAGNAHEGFMRKSSLMTLKYKRNDFDVLYLRNRHQWYLGGLKGIGKNINCTIAFLRRHFAKYDKVVCTGGSAGGYASLLFGSLLKVNKVITIDAQTDLDYVVEILPTKNQSHKTAKTNLQLRKKQCCHTWNKYNKIVNVLNEDVVYYMSYTGGDDTKKYWDLVLHGDYHYDQIKHFPSINKFNSRDDVILLIEKFLEE
jgi:hypothetical protein